MLSDSLKTEICNISRGLCFALHSARSAKLVEMWFGWFDKPVLVRCKKNDQTAFSLASANG